MISDQDNRKKQHIQTKRRELHHHVDDIYDHPLKVYFSILSFWGPNESFARTHSNIFGLEIVTAGSALFIQDNQKYEVRPGDIYILRKKCQHLYQTGSAGFLHKRCLTIDGPILEPLLYATGLHDCDHIPLPNPGRIAGIFRTIHRLLGQKEPGVLPEVSQLAYRLMVELGKARKPLYPAPIRIALTFMESHTAAPLTSVMIAQKAGLSPTHFNRLFKQYMGSSPVAYFIRKKMDLARYLLTQTTMSIKEVASAAGYDDPLYFSAQFKKQVGVSPSFYAQKSASPPPQSPGPCY
jgi:AraC-like DNA-binding protein